MHGVSSIGLYGHYLSGSVGSSSGSDSLYPGVPVQTTPTGFSSSLGDLPEQFLRRSIHDVGNSFQGPTDTEREWKGLYTLRAGVEEEFGKLVHVTSTSTSALLRAWEMFADSKYLWSPGILTYRDVLKGSAPQTPTEIFTFATLSFVISNMLFDCGNIQREQMLQVLPR